LASGASTALTRLSTWTTSPAAEIWAGAPQDYLYTVVERDGHGDRARVVGSMQRYLFAPDKPQAVIAALADPRTRLVTLTITMAGYDIDPVTVVFRAEDAAVQADLQGTDVPLTIFGYIDEALSRRRAAGIAPFTILSCDNRGGGPHRERVFRTAPRRGARAVDRGQRRFPSSMVDRITPETTAESRDLVARQFGVADRWPVVTEPFTQWFIQDTFCNERPPLDQVGVQFVSDVTPHIP
jgi:mannitol 2-dehydrogenase